MKKSTKLLLLQFGVAIAVMALFAVAIIRSPSPIPPRDIIIPGILCVLIYAHLNERAMGAIQSEFDGAEQ